MTRLSFVGVRALTWATAWVIGSMASSSAAEEPLRVVVCQGWLREPLSRLAEERVTIQTLRGERSEGSTYDTVNARWCVANASGASAFVFAGSTSDPLEWLWRERLANQGNRTMVVDDCGRHLADRASPQVLRQLHSLLVELAPQERARWDANLTRELQRGTASRSELAAGDLAAKNAGVGATPARESSLAE